MKSTLRIPCASTLVLLGALVAGPAWAGDDDETLTEIVNVLREEGLIDEDEHAELAAKAAKKDDRSAWTDRLSLWGDFRARYEAFLYEQDVYTRSTGGDLDDRHRGRYRVRLNGSGEVASRATVFFRVATGSNDARSTNQTLGDGDPNSPGVDFDTDDLRIDLAYATLTPFPDGELPGVEAGYLGVDVGKVNNPFLWKALPQDVLLWDGDITPEGASVRIRGEMGPLALFSNGGIYIIDENSGGSDPKIAGAQLGAIGDLAEAVSFGARGTLYHFFSLDDAFYGRAASGGNLIDGIGRATASIQVVESSAFLGFTMIELVPVTIYGSWAQNLSARSSTLFPGQDREDMAYLAAVFVGDKERLVELGIGWAHVEANAFPSVFLDSDLFDAMTNREGWFAEIERQLLEGVTLKLTGYKSKRIEGGLAHAVSGPGSDRLRGRADLNFEF